MCNVMSHKHVNRQSWNWDGLLLGLLHYRFRSLGCHSLSRCVLGGGWRLEWGATFDWVTLAGVARPNPWKRFNRLTAPTKTWANSNVFQWFAAMCRNHIEFAPSYTFLEIVEELYAWTQHRSSEFARPFGTRIGGTWFSPATCTNWTTQPFLRQISSEGLIQTRIALLKENIVSYNSIR